LAAAKLAKGFPVAGDETVAVDMGKDMGIDNYIYLQATPLACNSFGV